MTKLLHMEIKGCEQCPFSRVGFDMETHGRRCKHPDLDNNIQQKWIRTIPDYCPLQDVEDVEVIKEPVRKRPVGTACSQGYDVGQV